VTDDLAAEVAQLRALLADAEAAITAVELERNQWRDDWQVLRTECDELTAVLARYREAVDRVLALLPNLTDDGEASVPK
jgi:uncharacterized protein (DUF3084 family)